MANSSILGGAPAPAEPTGKDVDALGPSDSSDSGSDVQTDLNRSAMPDEASEGAFPIAHGSTSDAAGTGERAAADPAAPVVDADLLPDRTGTLPPGGRRRDAADPAAADVEAIAKEEDDDEDEDEG
ncbi:hypothetical protein [Xenophilus sp.]|uniref:hypothetical protein n=1 Tax=Xenophilus sp. TaxID=1873499 RepID=UPI0037DD593D